MIQKIIIKGRLPGRNESEKAARSHWSVGAKLKKQFTSLVAWECKAQKIKPVKQASIEVTFYEPNYRRDEDNVFGGIKYILDGLVQASVIPNDTRKCVSLKLNPVLVDKQNPRVEINIQKSLDK